MMMTVRQRKRHKKREGGSGSLPPSLTIVYRMDRPVYGGSSRSHTETDRLRLDYISPAYQSFFVSDDISVPVPGSEQIQCIPAVSWTRLGKNNQKN